MWEYLEFCIGIPHAKWFKMAINSSTSTRSTIRECNQSSESVSTSSSAGNPIVNLYTDLRHHMLW